MYGCSNILRRVRLRNVLLLVFGLGILLTVVEALLIKFIPVSEA
jgi:hypothetical protein